MALNASNSNNLEQLALKGLMIIIIIIWCRRPVENPTPNVLKRFH